MGRGIMADSAASRPGTEPPEGGEGLKQSSEQRVLELLDEIYELEQAHREQLTLRKLSSYLKSSLTGREAYAAIECFGPQLWPTASGAVYCVHATEEYLERVAAWGDPALHAPSLGLTDCWAMRRAQPHCFRDASVEIPCGHIVQVGGTLPSLCMPLIAQGQVLGLLHLQKLTRLSKSSNGLSSDPAAVLAAMVAEDLSLALANIRLREFLREQSMRDPLTGLFNRRFFEEFLIRELARAARKTRQVCMVLLDLDHFKLINDTFGHSAGDMVLRNVGPLLKTHVRESDVACRIGGEEFLLLLAELSLPTAVQRAEAIRKALREMSLTYEEHSLGPITASFGAAAYPDHGRTVESLFRAADAALYDAKRAGRDRVVPAAVTV